MKRILGVMVLLLGITNMAYAAASPVTIESSDGQSIAKVSNDSLKISNRSRAISNSAGTKLMYNEAVNIQSISIYAPTAGDNVAVFDSNVTTSAQLGGAVPEFEISIAANTSSATVYCGGAPFKNGIFVLATDSDVIITVVYDY